MTSEKDHHNELIPITVRLNYLYWGTLTQLPGHGGTHIHCHALERLERAGANLEVALGPPGLRSPHRRVCEGRTRPVKKSRFNTGVALSQ